MDFFLATMLSCADGKWILDGIFDAELTGAERSELVIQIIESMPRNCPAGYYTPGSRL